MKKLLFLLFLLTPWESKAQCHTVRHRISVQVGYSSHEIIDYSAGYHFMCCPYLGIGTSLGAWSIAPSGGWMGETEEEWYERQNLFVKPSLVLRTPSLFSIGSCDFSLECEPAVMFSARQNMTAWSGDGKLSENYKTDCISWHCNFTLGIAYRHVTFQAYYALSNLDVNRTYSIHTPGEYTKKREDHFGGKLSIYF